MLVPQLSAISLDGAMLGLEAMTMSFAALSNHPDELHRYERRTEALAGKLHARYNGRSLLRGGLGTDDGLNDEIEEDRKTAGEGKRVAVSVGYGVRGMIKKKQK